MHTGVASTSGVVSRDTSDRVSKRDTSKQLPDLEVGDLHDGVTLAKFHCRPDTATIC